MSKKYILYAAALTAILAALGWHLFPAEPKRAQRAANTAPSDLSDEEIDAIHKEWTSVAQSSEAQAQLPANVQHRPLEAEARPHVAVEAEQPEPTPTAVLEQHPAPEPPPPVPTKQEAEKRLVAAWTSQKTDEVWSNQIEQKADYALAQAKVPSDRLREVDCRQTLCRLEFEFGDRAEALRLYRFRLKDVDAFRVSKGQQVVVFFSRPGQRLDSIYATTSTP